MAYTTKRTKNRDLNKPTSNGEGQRLNTSNLKYSDSIKRALKTYGPQTKNDKKRNRKK